MRFRRAAILIWLSVLSFGCEERSEAQAAQGPQATAAAQPAAPPAINAASKADTYFQSKCVVCHGEKGAGDGPGSAALDPKPRNFGDAAWQASVTDDVLEKTILGGGAAVGKSPIMPGNPELKSQPEVVDALIAKIRAFK